MLCVKRPLDSATTGTGYLDGESGVISGEVRKIRNYRCPRAWQLSRGVLLDAGFLWDKASVLRNYINRRYIEARVSFTDCLESEAI